MENNRCTGDAYEIYEFVIQLYFDLLSTKEVNIDRGLLQIFPSVINEEDDKMLSDMSFYQEIKEVVFSVVQMVENDADMQGSSNT